MFNDSMLVEPEDIPYSKIDKWTVGIDYGTANATAFLLIGKSEDDVLYVTREYYFAGREEARSQGDFEAQKTDAEYAEDLKQFIIEAYPLTGQLYRTGSSGEHIPIIVDPAAASFILQLRRNKFRVIKANNSVLDGIRTVATYFSEGKLKISSECVNLINELHTYSWDMKAQEKGKRQCRLTRKLVGL